MTSIGRPDTWICASHGLHPHACRARSERRIEVRCRAVFVSDSDGAGPQVQPMICATDARAILCRGSNLRGL